MEKPGENNSRSTRAIIPEACSLNYLATGKGQHYSKWATLSSFSRLMSET